MREYTDTEIKEAADKIIGLVGGKKNITSVSNDEFVTLRVMPGYDDDATIDGREIDEIECIRGCFRGPDKVYILASKDIRTRLYHELIEHLGLTEKIGNIAINQDHIGKEIDANGKILQKKAAPFAWEENPDVRRWEVLAVGAATLAVKVLILAKMIAILKRKK